MRPYPESFKVSTPSDREIAIERDFDAPRTLVFDAFTKPELVRRWLLGPDGWSMPVCEIDLRVGGRYRYVWRKDATGQVMGLGGEFREVVRPARIVATERFDEAWYPGEAVTTTVFESRGQVTAVRVTVLYESRAARDTAARSGMEHGMAAGFTRLEEVLSPVPGQRPETRLIEAPVVTDTPPQLAAAIHLTVPRNEIQSVMGPGLAEIMTAVAAQGLAPSGPWFTHHLSMDPASFDFEICVPVPKPVDRVGRVVSRELPAVRVAHTVYSGPYERLGHAWAEFDDWISANGHVSAADFYECYAVGPESGPDSAAWRTELRRPLLGMSS
jgi:uncharacterized protein YndB with AHSA1/START domain/effector-binding domain-containing protein